MDILKKLPGIEVGGDGSLLMGGRITRVFSLMANRLI